MANWQAIMNDVDAFAKKIGVRDPVIDLYVTQNMEHYAESPGMYHLGHLQIGHDRSYSTTYAAKVDPPGPIDYKMLQRMAQESADMRRAYLEALDDAAREFLGSITYVRVPKKGGAFALKWDWRDWRERENGDERRGESTESSVGNRGAIS